jgi:hypothetical protein
MTQRAPRRRQAIKISQQKLSRSTFRVFDELPERRRNVALRRARDLDDGLGLGVVALGLAARERGDHGVFVFLSNKGKKQKGKKSLPVFHSFVSLSFFVCTPLSFSLSLSREERDNRRRGRRSISLPLSRSLLSPITSF